MDGQVYPVSAELADYVFSTYDHRRDINRANGLALLGIVATTLAVVVTMALVGLNVWGLIGFQWVLNACTVTMTLVGFSAYFWLQARSLRREYSQMLVYNQQAREALSFRRTS